MITLDKVMGGVRQVFGEQSYKVRVIQAGSSFKVEPKEMVHDGVWIRSEGAIETQINNLFYDMMCEACADEADYIPGLDDGEWGYDEDCCGEEDFA
jgi:hypothetical protein